MEDIERNIQYEYYHRWQTTEHTKKIFIDTFMIFTTLVGGGLLKDQNSAISIILLMYLGEMLRQAYLVGRNSRQSRSNQVSSTP